MTDKQIHEWAEPRNGQPPLHGFGDEVLRGVGRTAAGLDAHFAPVMGERPIPEFEHVHTFGFGARALDHDVVAWREQRSESRSVELARPYLTCHSGGPTTQIEFNNELGVDVVMSRERLGVVSLLQ